MQDAHATGMQYTGGNVVKLIAREKDQTRRLATFKKDGKALPLPSREEVVKLSGSGYSWRPIPTKPHEWHVCGPVWAVRKLMGIEPHLHCPYGVPGDLIWTREDHALQDGNPGGSWAKACPTEPGYILPVYRTDYLDGLEPIWRLARHQAQAACRCVLTLKEIRLEPLQSITDLDCYREGCPEADPDPRAWYLSLWDGLNPRHMHPSNPWVWVLTLELLESGPCAWKRAQETVRWVPPCPTCKSRRRQYVRVPIDGISLVCLDCRYQGAHDDLKWAEIPRRFRYEP